LEDISLTIEKLKKANFTLSVAESCTGGRIASNIVSFEGASEFFLGGVVTYSNLSKIRILNIDKKRIELYGVVSPEIAKDMSNAAKDLFGSDISISITGNVGSKSGDGLSPIGQVFISINFMNKVDVWEFNFNDDRNTNIESAVSKVFILLNNILKN
jgi:nicotinamide-nucleotide amidase